MTCTTGVHKRAECVSVTEVANRDYLEGRARDRLGDSTVDTLVDTGTLLYENQGLITNFASTVQSSFGEINEAYEAAAAEAAAAEAAAAEATAAEATAAEAAATATEKSVDNGGKGVATTDTVVDSSSTAVADDSKGSSSANSAADSGGEVKKVHETV